jgi:manganese/iron transport system permease protein
VSPPPEALASGVLAALLFGVTSATVGVYVVLRRMAFIGDALAHTVLPGVVLASLAGTSLFGGAAAAALVTALGIGWLARRRTLHEDAAIGVLFTAMFAAGILLASAEYQPEELHHVLFGDLLGVRAGDLALLLAIAVVALGSLALLHKELELASFDPVYAEVIGVRTDRLRYALLLLVALTVVAGLKVVGVLLTSALLVTPAAAASLLTRRVPAMMLLASALAVLAGVAGLFLSYHLRVSSGAATVLVCTLGFGLAWTARAAAPLLAKSNGGSR